MMKTKLTLLPLYSSNSKIRSLALRKSMPVNWELNAKIINKIIMILLISLVCSLAVFGFWMNIVGNPHVVETVIGLVIAITVGVLVNRGLKQVFSKKKN